MGLQLTDTYHSLLKAVPRPPPLVSDLGDVLGGLALSKKRASAKQNNLKPRLSGRWWTGATHHRSSSWSSTLVNDLDARNKREDRHEHSYAKEGSEPHVVEPRDLVHPRQVRLQFHRNQPPAHAAAARFEQRHGLLQA